MLLLWDKIEKVVEVMPNTSDRLKLIGAMVIFGTLGPFVRQIELSSGALALCRALMAAVLLGLYFLLRREKLPWAQLKKTAPKLILSGIAMGINWILLFEAYRYTTISLATLSYYFAPTLVMVACPILFHEKMTAKQVLCFVLSTLGLVLVIGVGTPAQGASHLHGIMLGLAAAVFYATVTLLNKSIGEISGVQRTFVQFLAAIAVLAPYVACTGGVALGNLSVPGWSALLAVGLVHTFGAYCLYFSALKGLRGQETALLSYLDPAVAVFISAVLLGESMAPLQLLGGAMIIGFAVWNEYSAVKAENLPQ